MVSYFGDLYLFLNFKLFVAVKCNDDVNVIKLLAFLGAGFDCASKVIYKSCFNISINYSLESVG